MFERLLTGRESNGEIEARWSEERAFTRANRVEVFPSDNSWTKSHTRVQHPAPRCEGSFLYSESYLPLPKKTLADERLISGILQTMNIFLTRDDNVKVSALHRFCSCTPAVAANCSPSSCVHALFLLCSNAA